ncbi:putative reverse transcriptase domain-containing protein [Tanacetum coccineum]
MKGSQWGSTLLLDDHCPTNCEPLTAILALGRAGHAAYTDRFNELARLVPHLVTPESRIIERYVYGLAPQIRGMVAATEPKTIQKVVQIFWKEWKDDNKRLGIEMLLLITVNPVGRENTGTWPKCTICNSFHAPGGLCRICYNCNRPGHFARDCRSVPRNMNPVNAKNPTVRACLLGGKYDHSGQLALDPRKIEVVKNWKTLRTLTEVRSLLGLVEYYRRFIGNFSKIAKSLTILTQKSKTFEWGGTGNMAFQDLEGYVMIAPIPSALPDGPKDFVVYCDASGIGLGCVLMQREGVVDEFADSQEMGVGFDEIIAQEVMELCTTWIEYGTFKAIMRCAPFKALYGRKRYSLIMWEKLCPEKRRKPLEFSVGDYVLLKVSALERCVLFGKEREVSTQVEILEREFKKLKRSRIAIVKVRWNSKRGPEFTWEREDQMKLKYPQLFSNDSS